MTNKKNSIGNQYSAEIYAKTKKYQKIYKFELGTGKNDTWNNEADAFKHTFGSADMALKITSFLSKKVGDYHENHATNNPKYEENMDKWNNNEGRKIAAEICKKYSLLERVRLINSGKMDDIIAEKVMQKMRKGELITNPFTDKRKFNEQSVKDGIFNYNNRVYHRDEVSMKDLDNPIIMDTYLDQALEYGDMPTKEDLDKRVGTGELVYVDEYTRDDGTKVSGYYRSYPNS